MEGAIRVDDGRFAMEGESTSGTARVRIQSPSGKAPDSVAVWKGLDLQGDATASDLLRFPRWTLSASGALQAAEVAAAGARLGDLVCRWKASNATAELVVSSVRAYGGAGEAVGNVDFSSWPPTFSARGSVSNLDLKSFTENFDVGKLALEGKVNVAWTGKRSRTKPLVFEAEVAGASEVVQVDKKTVRKLLEQLPKTGATRLPLRTLDRKFPDQEMVPFDTFRITSRSAGDHVTNQITMENKYFRIVLDVGVDWPVVKEFLLIRQETLAGA